MPFMIDVRYIKISKIPDTYKNIGYFLYFLIFSIFSKNIVIFSIPATASVH